MSPASCSVGACRSGQTMHTCTHHTTSDHRVHDTFRNSAGEMGAACAEVAGFTTNLQPPDRGIGRIGAGRRLTSRIGLRAANGGQ